MLNPCAHATDIHVVVIGSSTAAGAGPSNSSNAWVNRYRDYLQSINSNNTVTNLAQGGTKTYDIMPDWFVPPANRPVPNPAKNITQAISLGPDAIIVNMPSNDAGWGYGINEQMFNFITMANSSDSAGIPIWICTTQPRNYWISATAIQLGVRDSIFSYFGTKAIDFWTGFADINNGIDSIYDSGDGIHMNDTAHGILNERVIAAGIPNTVGDTLSYVDHAMDTVYLSNASICGDSNTILHIVVSNLGITSIATQILNFERTNNTNSMVSNTPLFLNAPLSACTRDTVSVNLNSYNGVDYNLKAYLNGADSLRTNDTSSVLNLLTNGHPFISVQNDTICIGDSTILNAVTSPSDTIVWYDALVGSDIIGYGSQFPVNGITSSQSYFPEAVKGPLHYAKSLFTTEISTTNFNGIMFDIIASDTITIDSLLMKVNTTGSQLVTAFNKMGSSVGYENTATAWTSWGTDNVNASTAGEFQIVNFPDVTLFPNDTLGVYLHMPSGARLSYRNQAAVTYSDAKISVMNGAGIAHTFGTAWSPRNWSGEVFYHYGFRPQGDCTSERKEITAVVSQPTVNLGNDTTINWDQSILLNTSTNFTSYTWSNASVNPQLLVDSNNFSLGLNTIWLETINEFGCKASDTIELTLASPFVLPLGLLNLEIHASKNGIVLDWETSEKNTKHLTILKSANGSSFSALDTVQATNSSEPNASEHEYQFLDENPNFGNNYYRLELEDFSGNKSYSDIKVAAWFLGEHNLTMFPNPVADKLNVNINSPTNARAKLSVLDLQGRIVLSKSARLSKGSNLVQMNLSALAAGQYEVQFILNDRYSYVGKIIIE